MTVIAGVDIHAELSKAFSGVLPPMTLVQNGKDFPGVGTINDNTANFISNVLTQPKEGDLIKQSDKTFTVSIVSGNEDSWALSLSETEVPVLDSDDEFDLDVLDQGSGFLLLTRMDAGNASMRGQWRNGTNQWNGFSTEKRTLLLNTGVGRIEISAYRVNDDGTSTEPLNKVVETT